jgi:hypothetical protein
MHHEGFERDREYLRRPGANLAGLEQMITGSAKAERTRLHTVGRLLIALPGLALLPASSEADILKEE